MRPRALIRPAATAVFLATYSRALLVLVTLVNVSLLLAALRDWQVYRLSGIGAAAAGPSRRGRPAHPGGRRRADRPGGSRLPGPAGRRVLWPSVNRDDDRFWKGGLIYINRDDPAIMVGNRFGSRLDTQPREPEGVAALRWHPGRHRRAGRGPRSGRHMSGTSPSPGPCIPLKARPERLCHHLRRLEPERRDLLTETAENTWKRLR